MENSVLQSESFALAKQVHVVKYCTLLFCKET